MKQFLFAILTLAVMGLNSASAATVELNRGGGLPGDLVTLYLSIDEVPLGEDDGFSLEFNLHFDPRKVQYKANSAKKVGIFRDEADASGAAPPSLFSFIDESARPEKVFLALIGSYSGGTPGGGNLISLDFLIAADAGDGEIPIEIELISSSNNGVSSARNGAVGVSAVPVPPALLLFAAPFAWMFSRLRRS